MAETMNVRGMHIEVRMERRYNVALFVAEFEGQAYEDREWSGLEAQLAKATKVAQAGGLEVHFVTKGGKRGVVRGVHATTGALLVTYADGTKDQVRAYSGQVLAPMDDAELARYRNLRTQVDEAKAAVATFEANHGFDLQKAVDEALNKAQR